MTLEIAARPQKPKHPYPGLRAFEPDEWPIFFGRDRMVDDVIERLAAQRVVFVHGASGSGKSSLVRAGVIPRLAREQRRQGETWRGALMRPSGGPLWNLARALAELEGKGEDLDRVETLARGCNARDASISGVAARLAGLDGARICLLVDQFEELFRYAKETSREEAETFVDLLVREAAKDDGAAHVVITMRSEFLGDCARYEGLAETINETQYLVPRMDHDGLVRAIERPARFYGGEIAPGLSERLIAEARGHDDELPLIQHALMLMWNDAAAKAAGDAVRVGPALLDEAGGLAALLSSHADRVLEHACLLSDAASSVDGAPAAPPRLDQVRAKVAENIFRALTDINADAQAIRRPQKFADLVAICGGDEKDARQIIDAFRADGVSFLTPYAPQALVAKTIIDIGHEAVIRCWGKIADPHDGWLAKEFRDGRQWALLLAQAKRFEADKRDLLSAAATEETQKFLARHGTAWAKRYGGEWALVGALRDASVKARDDARRAEKLRQGLMAGAAAGFLGLAGFGFWQWHLATQAKNDAQHALGLATKAEQDAQAERDHAKKALGLATKTADGLVQDLARRFEHAAGVKAEVVSDILSRARKLQDELAAGGATGDDFRQGRVAALIATVDSRLSMGDTEGALSAAREAVNLAKSSSTAEPNNLERRWDLASAYERLGDVQITLGAVTGALDAYREELAIYTAAAEARPDYKVFRRNVAVSHGKIGRVLEAQGDLPAALASYRKGLAIMEELSASDPNNRTWRRDVAVSQEDVGDVLTAQGDQAGALDAYRKDLAITRALADSAPGNTEAKRTLSVSYEKIGNALRSKGDLPGALEAYKKDLELTEALSQSDPGNQEWERDLSVSLSKVADVLRAQGANVAALKLYRRDQNIAETLAAANSGNPELRRDVGISYERIGVVMRTLGNFSEALDYHMRELTIAKELKEKFPGNKRVQIDVAETIVKIDDTVSQMKSKSTTPENVRLNRETLARRLAEHPELRELRDRLTWFRDQTVDFKGAKRAVIRKAESAAQYEQALQLQGAFIERTESDETREFGKPGVRTADALGDASWYALFSKKFGVALADASRAHTLAPELLWIETNRAHALMFLGHDDEARAIYLSHDNDKIPENNDKPWQEVIAKDFQSFREAKLPEPPLMSEIAAKLAKTKPAAAPLDSPRPNSP